MAAARRLVEGPPAGLGLSYQALAITSNTMTNPPVAYEGATTDNSAGAV
jgi:hypothetical protein